MDYAVLEWINNHLHGSNIVNEVIKWISFLGDTGLIWIVIGALLLSIKGHRRFGLLLLISLLLGWVINDYILKLIISRDRPFATYPQFLLFIESIKMSKPSGSSFPSGHAFSSFNCAVILFFANKKKFGAVAIALAILIALSRVFLCVHYPTDVLAGAVLGSLAGYLAVFCYKKIYPRYEKRRGAKNAS